MTPQWFVAISVAGLALAAQALATRGTNRERVAQVELPVVVTEASGMVRLRVRLPDNVRPGSVEVQLTGRTVLIIAQDIANGQLRSQAIRVPRAVVEEGAQAQYEGDGSLTITLRAAHPPGAER